MVIGDDRVICTAIVLIINTVYVVDRINLMEESIHNFDAKRQQIYFK